MLALIPMRGGSKRIPKKNIKEVCGKPLCQWVIDEAKKTYVFDRIIVSTDCEEIADVVFDHNKADVDVLMRPKELALDDTPTEEAMLHVAETEDFSVMCLIQATSPLTEAYDFQSARAKFNSWGCDSMLSVKKVNGFRWLKDQINRRKTYKNRPTRWGIQPTGNFYFTKKWVLLQEKSRLGGTIGYYWMPEERVLDIDEPNDLEKAEFYLRRRECE